jgi:hypothetical protein
MDFPISYNEELLEYLSIEKMLWQLAQPRLLDENKESTERQHNYFKKQVPSLLNQAYSTTPVVTSLKLVIYGSPYRLVIQSL